MEPGSIIKQINGKVEIHKQLSKIKSYWTTGIIIEKKSSLQISDKIAIKYLTRINKNFGN